MTTEPITKRTSQQIQDLGEDKSSKDYSHRGTCVFELLWELHTKLKASSALDCFRLRLTGLTCLPTELLIPSNMTCLNLMGNQLKSLPNDFGSHLARLRVLGLKDNQLSSLPPSLGQCTGLVQLYLTNNLLTQLPETIVNLTSLRKLQCSFNILRSLPPHIHKMSSLELFRASVNPPLNDLTTLESCPALTWTSFASSEYSKTACERSRYPKELRKVQRKDIHFGRLLGTGASGNVYLTEYEGQPAALKLYRGDVSPDGHVEDEIRVVSALDHQSLSTCLALVMHDETHAILRTEETGCALERQDLGENGKGAALAVTGSGQVVLEQVVAGVLMPVVEGEALAERPDGQSVLRCRYVGGLQWTAEEVRWMAWQLADAMQYMHAQHIAHGDLYAHNVIYHRATRSLTLVDYGASFFYDPQGIDFERLEVRAYGILLSELSSHSAPPTPDLQALAETCQTPTAQSRPSFCDIATQLYRAVHTHS